MKIDMDIYARLGDQRLVFDDWLRDVGLLPTEPLITDIVFGEGVHHLGGYESDPGPNGTRKVRLRTVVDPETGVFEKEGVRREWDWAGPLPPRSVCVRIRDLAA